MNSYYSLAFLRHGIQAQRADENAFAAAAGADPQQQLFAGYYPGGDQTCKKRFNILLNNQ